MYSGPYNLSCPSVQPHVISSLSSRTTVLRSQHCSGRRADAPGPVWPGTFPVPQGAGVTSLADVYLCSARQRVPCLGGPRVPRSVAPCQSSAARRCRPKQHMRWWRWQGSKWRFLSARYPCFVTTCTRDHATSSFCYNFAFSQMRNNIPVLHLMYFMSNYPETWYSKSSIQLPFLSLGRMFEKCLARESKSTCINDFSWVSKLLHCCWRLSPLSAEHSSFGPLYLQRKSQALLRKSFLFSRMLGQGGRAMREFFARRFPFAWTPLPRYFQQRRAV